MSWLFVVILAALMVLVAVSAYRTGRLLQLWTPPANILLGVPDNLFRLLLVAICLLFGYRLGPGIERLGWQTADLARQLLVGAGVGWLLVQGLNAAGAAAVRRWGPDVYSDRIVRFTMPRRNSEWAPVLAAMLPAVAVEELLFRSLPLGGLSDLLAPQLLLWPLALFFGLLHWPQGGWGVVGTTLVGIVLSLLFLATHSLWAPLAAHYVLNVFQLWLAWRGSLNPARIA